MEKIDIESATIVSDDDILKLEADIKELKSNKSFINDNSTPLSILKQTICNNLQICYLELRKDRYKLVSNFQKKDDHGFFSIKSANEELKKIIGNASKVNELSYLIDFSFFNYNSINYSIIHDMKKNQFILKCIEQEIPKDKYYNFIVKSIKQSDKNFSTNCLEYLQKETMKLKDETEDITRNNQDLVTKHVISKNLFDMIKEYIDIVNNKEIDERVVEEISDKIKYEYKDSEKNEYCSKIKKLKNIELNYNSMDEKYKCAIKNFNYVESFELLEKLKVLSITKDYIISILNKQKDILKCFTKRIIFTEYIKYLEELIVNIDKRIDELLEQLNKNNLSEYIELFDLINSLAIYNDEIKSYEDKISKTNENTEIISYNNKITALSIKKRRVDISLLKNRYFDSSKIDKNIDMSKSKENGFDLASNIDDEIRECNEELSKCYDKVDEIVLNNLIKEYKDNNLESTIDFIEYLIIKNNYMGAKLYTLKNKLLDLVYSKYIQSDMEDTFTNYILSNPILNIENIITNDEIMEFEQSKVKCKTVEKNIN